MIELLSPAGNLEKLKIALLYGADAVYVGGRDYSLRANAKNFSREELKEASIYAHKLGKKIYVTVNIIFHNEDTNGLEEYLKYLSDIKIDAVIVSDIYVINLINKLKLPLEIHISTQSSILNKYAGMFYKNLNAKRLVLAREASREDIKSIKDLTNLDLECFVHGAMCTSFSGRCVMSNAVTNRDANRGGCAQVCRFDFEDFHMTSKDLNMISNIKDMIDIGVNSFKVEGRMRGIYYIATVILSYRRIIDKIINNTLTQRQANYYLNVLNRVANRESMPQFYDGIPDERGEYFLEQNEVTNQDFLGLVLDYDEVNGIVTLEERNKFNVGDEVLFFGPNHETFKEIINIIYDEEGNQLSSANKPNMIVKLKISHHLDKFDMMKVFDKNNILL